MTRLPSTASTAPFQPQHKILPPSCALPRSLSTGGSLQLRLQDTAQASSNSAFGSGGVVYAGSGARVGLHVEGSATLSKNTASGWGGVLYADSCAELGIGLGQRTRVDSNIALSGAFLALQNLTLSEPLTLSSSMTGNKASGGPGGLLWLSGCSLGDVVMGGWAAGQQTCLITNNTASSEGGRMAWPGYTLRLHAKLFLCTDTGT